MKLSKTTLDVLKNFSDINSGLVIRKTPKGQAYSVVKVCSQGKNILGVAHVPEIFPTEIRIQDMKRFLALIDEAKIDVDIDFQDSHMVLTRSTGTKITWYYAAEGMVLTPEKELVLAPTVLSFMLPLEKLDEIRKLSATSGVKDVSITPGADTNLTFKVCDRRNDTAPLIEFPLEAQFSSLGSDFEFCLVVENLKFQSGSYDVILTGKRQAAFKKKDQELQYVVALEKMTNMEQIEAK